MNNATEFLTDLTPLSNLYKLDFMKEYVNYADIFEAPPEAHEAVALTVISAVANANVWIQNGGQKISLDNWTLLLSGSGVGRNTLLSLLWPVLEEAGIDDLVRNTTWGSKQGFYQDLAENPTGFLIWEELAAALKALSDARFGEAKPWLTNCYDNFRNPADIQYRRAGSLSTPPIVFNSPPRISILATSSQAWFIDSLSQEDSTGGFIPRWFLIQLPDLKRAIPIPNEPNVSLTPDLADCLRDVRNMKGAIDLSRVQDIYADWYPETKKRFEEQPNTAVATAFWHRHRVHLLKLAAIYAMSSDGGMTVSPESMERAIVFARKTENTIFSLIKTGMNREGNQVDKLEQEIKASGVDGLSKSEFTRAFQDMKQYDRDSRLHTLLDGNAVGCFLRKTPGRSAEILVHSDFVQQHGQNYPEDKLRD